VLIVGAGGGVGGYATQLVAASGATTIATCRPADAERVQGLGAAETIDYNRGVASQLQERFPDGVDSVIDVANRDPAAFQAIAEKVRPGWPCGDDQQSREPG